MNIEQVEFFEEPTLVVKHIKMRNLRGNMCCSSGRYMLLELRLLCTMKVCTLIHSAAPKREKIVQLKFDVKIVIIWTM